MASAAGAAADTVYLESLQWLVANNDYVVHGEVTGANQLPHRPGRYSLQLRANRGRLKGSTGRWFTAVYSGQPPRVGSDVVVFSKEGWKASSCGRDPKTGKVYRYRAQFVTRLLDGSRGWTLPTMGFGRVSGLQALRTAIVAEQRAPSSKVKLMLPVPRGSVLRSGRDSAFDSVNIAVPRDRRAERYILTLLDAKLAGHRVLGTQLLAHYESVPNIKRLLAMRSDPAVIVAQGGVRKRWVKQGAEITLKRWGVPLPAAPRAPKP